MSAGFDAAAREYRIYGAIAIPVRPDESRAPCVRWKRLKKPLADDTIARLTARISRMPQRHWFAGRRA